MADTNKPDTSTALTSMTVEEARSVYWLRNNHRPLGELLDEGFLNEARLAWAAERAYDPRLKQAAAVLLDWMKRSSPPPPPQAAEAPVSPGGTPAQAIDAGITIEQARATLWPFKPFKGQRMGVLIDTRQITLKDLVYAIENAWDERVRRAAIALAAVCLNQAVNEPPPPAGPLKVLSGGRSFAERRQLQLMLIEGFVLGASLGALVVWAIFSFPRSRAAQPGRALAEIVSTPTGVIALLIALALMAAVTLAMVLSLKTFTDWLEREFRNYRKGQEGEEQVVEALRQNLDGSWTLFRNVTLPGRGRADIDAVLVGPPGVWALEIKNLSGAYRNVGERWEFRARGGWKALKQSPSRQARDNAARLAHFLEADGIRQWVTPVVVWANRESELAVQNPAVAVWEIARLPEELGNLWQHKPIEESIRARVIEKLTALCQRTDEEVDR